MKRVMPLFNLDKNDTNFDRAVRQCFRKNPNSCISWALSASYAYYCRYESLLSDTTYDKMMKYILDNYEKLEHPHKHLLKKESLTAGTAFHLKAEDYPAIVVNSAEDFIRQLNTHLNSMGT